MTAIQILLVVAAFLWLASYLARVRTLGLTRVLAVVAALGGIVLVLFPPLSTRLAGLLGVTRGVDLVIYLSLVAFGFLWLQLAVRMRALEDQLALLVRRIALDGGSAGTSPGASAQDAAPPPPDTPSVRS
ncbi:MAG: DUF2304 family protein [Myxococcota bacterium]